ncbi:unnamed protein product [Parajaminaea phylloscopi]
MGFCSRFLFLCTFLALASLHARANDAHAHHALSRSAHNPSNQGRSSPALNARKAHTGKRASKAKAKKTACIAYDRSNFTVKPVELQKWWDSQKAKDTAAGGLMRPPEDHRPYDGPFQPFVAPAPRFNAYSCCLPSDDNTTTKALPEAGELKAMNGVILSFLNSNQTELKFQAWVNAPVETRKRLLVDYHRAGVSLWASVFGGDEWETPVTNNFDPEALGYLHGEIIYTLGFDGVDVDLEDFPAFNTPSHAVVGWTADYITALRKWLPKSEGFGLTAAPVAPWFTPNRTTYCHEAWFGIDKKVGHHIDYYNIQFYNQGVGAYDSCQTILHKSNLTAFPETAIFQIAKNGVPLDKLVIGKPGWPNDAANGWVAPEDLSVCAKEARDAGWKAGFSSWQLGHATSQWFREARLWAFYDKSL